MRYEKDDQIYYFDNRAGYDTLCTGVVVRVRLSADNKAVAYRVSGGGDQYPRTVRAYRVLGPVVADLSERE